MSSIATEGRDRLIELFGAFVHPNRQPINRILAVQNYRGNATETGARRMRAILGPEAYEHLHWDTLATDGRVALWIPRYRCPDAQEAPPGFRLLTARHHWALSEIDEVSPEVSRASAKDIQRVPIETAQRLYSLPGLEFVRVRYVHFFEYGSGQPKRKREPAPADVVYFRFAGGYGVVAA